jgi:L-ascorbate metabolism protein UlaG (beta-lactamase superfamily)
MGPDEAVKVFHDLGARWLVPMHYGTFKLSFEHMDEPPLWLQELAKGDGLSERLKILEEGVPYVL